MLDQVIVQGSRPASLSPDDDEVWQHAHIVGQQSKDPSCSPTQHVLEAVPVDYSFASLSELHRLITRVIGVT